MAETQDGPVLALWQCHKIVAAGKITKLINEQRPHLGENGSPGGGVDTVTVAFTVQTADGTDSETPICPGDTFFARGTPAVGDYFVQYDDRYMSWSPAKAFEDGYTRIATDHR